VISPLDVLMMSLRQLSLISRRYTVLHSSTGIMMSWVYRMMVTHLVHHAVPSSIMT